MRCNGTAPITLAFAHLNLRFNPFGELDPEERARVAVLPPLGVRSGEVVQVMGEAGRGKTTHLLAWHAAIPASGYEYVPEGSDRLRTLSLPAVFFADEAQRLCRRDLDRLFCSVDRLVIATHADLAPLARRPVRTLVLEGLDLDKLEGIVSRRIEAARRGTGPVPSLSRASLAALIRRFGDDLRSLEAHLYEVFQSLEEPCDVEV
jgi:ABC-type uncharacterized transport system YnjBCD ATPase subunit